MPLGGFMKLDRKTLVGVGVALALAALTYFFGPDVVSMVKDQVQTQEVAPVQSESPASQPTGE
jgi:hypothetical protein